MLQEVKAEKVCSRESNERCQGKSPVIRGRDQSHRVLGYVMSTDLMLRAMVSEW